MKISLTTEIGRYLFRIHNDDPKSGGDAPKTSTMHNPMESAKLCKDDSKTKASVQ